METIGQREAAERLNLTISEVGRLMLRGKLHEVDRRGAQRYVTLKSVRRYERGVL